MHCAPRIDDREFLYEHKYPKVYLVKETCIFARDVGVVVSIESAAAMGGRSEDRLYRGTVPTNKVDATICEVLGHKSNVVDIKDAIRVCVSVHMHLCAVNRPARTK